MHDVNYLKFTEGNASTNRRHASLARPYMEIIQPILPQAIGQAV